MSKLVLVLNCGSSSLKFAVINSMTGESLLSGLAECLTLKEARIKWSLNGKHEASLGENATHDDALLFIIETILRSAPELQENILAVGHRVVHGGERFTSSVLIDDEVLEEIRVCSSLAPLHNPANILGIEVALKAFPKLKNIAVFDTAFHQTMPEESFLYALPYSLYKKHGIRRYGMHGTSHSFIAKRVASQLDKPLEQLNIISCHLGNGSSVCAILNGHSVDTSMGLTPLEGLVMGTRCGDIDPAIIFHLHEQLGYPISEINDMLTKQSGLLGLTEASPDCRYIEDNYQSDQAAKRALDVMCQRLAKYIAGYTTKLEGRLDAIAFSGGIGENAAPIRAEVIKRLAILGFKLDEVANLECRFGKEGIITASDSRVAMVVSTNEELVIAQESAALSEL